MRHLFKLCMIGLIGMTPLVMGLSLLTAPQAPGIILPSEPKRVHETFPTSSGLFLPMNQLTPEQWWAMGEDV